MKNKNKMVKGIGVITGSFYCRSCTKYGKQMIYLFYIYDKIKTHVLTSTLKRNFKYDTRNSKKT